MRMSTKSLSHKAAAVIGAAALLLAGSGVPAFAEPANSAPQQASSEATALSSAFERASAKYGIPKSLLMGLSYAQSGWSSGQKPLAGVAVGPMALIDGSLVAQGKGEGKGESGPGKGSLQMAAEVTGVSEDVLRRDAGANIDAGAALLAYYGQQNQNSGNVNDASSWYSAVVDFAGGAASSRSLADSVYQFTSAGTEKRFADGTELQLPADPTAIPPLARQGRSVPGAAAPVAAECPAGLPCSFDPAYYDEYQTANGTTYGNYYQADRKPGDIKYLVIHDIEGSAQAAINTFKKPGVSSNYVISDQGEVTQMVQVKDMPWTNGNMWVNQNAISIEVAGYAADPSGYTDASYAATAKLVKYLAEKYGIPVNRQQVIGHNNVPGVSAGSQKSQHWDPGPYYDWNRLLREAGAPQEQATAAKPVAGSIVTVQPGYQLNSLAFDASGCTAQGVNGPVNGMQPARASSAVLVRSAPSENAPLISDPAQQSDASLTPTGQPGTIQACNWGDQISAGQQFVVVETSVQTDGTWLAVWYSGQKAWLKLSEAVTVAPAAGLAISPKPGKDSIQVWATPYPEPGEYPYTLEHTNTSDPNQEGYWDGFSTPSTIPYMIGSGQSYVANGPYQASYFNAGSLNGGLVHDRLKIVGGERYYQISLNHRFAYVKASDVDARNIAVPTTPVDPPTAEPTTDPTVAPIVPIVAVDDSGSLGKQAVDVKSESLAATGVDVLQPLLISTAAILFGSVAVLAGRLNLVARRNRRH